MQTYKTIFGLIAISLTFVGYVPYLQDILKGQTKPHLYSWFLWGFVTLVVFALQASHQAGLGGVVTLTAALMCFVVIVMGARFGSLAKATLSDKISALLAISGLMIWLIAQKPMFSVTLLTLIDVLAFIPTIRKSWTDPFSETLVFYWLNTLRFFLAVVSLAEFTFITSIYPIVWCLINGLFAFFLFVRRQHIKTQSNHQTIR